MTNTHPPRPHPATSHPWRSKAPTQAAAARARPRHHEDGEAMALIAWASVTTYRERKLIDYLLHIPNGGKRNALEAARLKKMGVRAGVPDYLLHIPTEDSAGLWIELKAPGSDSHRRGRATELQTEQIRHLRECGYWTAIAYGWEEAAFVICAYLGIRAPLGGGR